MCGGFHCSKISLQLLNVTYLLVAVLLIGIAAYAKASAVITSFEIAGVRPEFPLEAIIEI